MSLLNDMLKDLNNRAPSAVGHLTPHPLHDRQKIQINLIAWVAVLLLFLGLVSVMTLSMLHPKENLASQIIPVEAKKTTEPRDTLAASSEQPEKASSHKQSVLHSSIPGVVEHSALVASRPVQEMESDAWVDQTVSPDEYETESDELVQSVFAPVEKKMAKITPEEWHDEHLNQAFEAIEDGDYPQAIHLLKKILTQFPASIETRENLAALYIEQNELDRAYEVLDKGLEFDPDSFRLLTMKSRLLVEQGKHDEALALLEQFKPDIRKEPEYYGVLAAIFQTIGRSGEAGSLYQSLVKIEPSNGQYWLGYAMALENKKANQQAIEAYKRASQSDNTQSSVRAYAEQRLKTLQG